MPEKKLQKKNDYTMVSRQLRTKVKP
jgi:hypothetical protein